MAKRSIFQFAKLLMDRSVAESAPTIKDLRYYWQWKKSLQPGKNAIDDELPWITFPAIDFIKKHLHKNSRVFEYGGGGSSLFFADIAGEVVTVEHHPVWFKKVQERMQHKQGANWKGLLIPAETRTNKEIQLDPSNPAHYFTNEEPYIDCTFKSYVLAIDAYPDNYFDMVMIDGRSRSSCIWHSMPKIKPGGYLIVDNSNRKNYFRSVQGELQAKFSLVSDRRAPSPYLEYLTQTVIWRKK